MNNILNIHNHNSYLLVELGTLRKNARTILSGLGAGTELIPVIKDDAYGLGIAPVARTLCSFPEIRTLAVAHVSEGLTLRESGIDRAILVMGGALPFQLEAAVEAGLTLACAHPGFLEQVRAAAEKCGKRASVQIKIDTGLHRIGFGVDELDGMPDEIRLCQDLVEISGAFSHFSDVANPALCEREYALFQDALSRLEAGGVKIPLRHMSCSAASERWPQYNMGAIRCGRRLYMDSPDAPTGAIRELASFRAFITQIKARRAGETLGYGGAVTLERDTLVATVGVGYGDGLNQALFPIRAPVLAGGRRCRMLACCMDQCMIDVSGLSCQIGDEVTFFGYDRDGNFLSSQEVAALVNRDEGCGLTSALSARVARVYTE